jgi:ADP-heptose:LPS heptosyltransferase
MKKILIIHTWGIGDLIMITPALLSLKEQFQNVEIDFLFFQKSAALPIINGHLHRKIYDCDYKISTILKKISELNIEKYDYSFVTSGVKPWKAAIFQSLLNVKCKIGEYRRIKLPVFHKLVKYENTLHRLESSVKLIQSFLPEFCLKYKKPVFFMTQEDMDFSGKWIKQNCAPQKVLFGIHHGSNIKAKNRRWPYLYFVALIEMLKKNYPAFELLLIAGADELTEAKEIQKKTPIKLVTGISLGKVAAIVSHCDYFLNSDSVMGHIASCFNCEIFTIFGPADSTLTKPVSEKSHIIKLPENLPCQPCEIQNPTGCSWKCLYQLTPEYVFNQMKNVIQNEEK